MNIKDLLQKFELGDADLSMIRKAGEILTPKLDEFVSSWYEWLKAQPEFRQFFPDPELVARVKKL